MKRLCPLGETISFPETKGMAERSRQNLIYNRFLLHTTYMTPFNSAVTLVYTLSRFETNQPWHTHTNARKQEHKHTHMNARTHALVSRQELTPLG